MGPSGIRHATRISLPLLGAFVVGAIAYGGLYTFPALSVALAHDFGINRALAVTPWTTFLIVTAVASPLLGRAYDEWADRDLLTASMVLLAGGWFAVYLAPDISLVVLAYAAFHALGLQLAFIGITTAVARRYAGASGLALGIAYAGPGIGVAIALPVAASLIESGGWRTAALAFLAASLVGVVFVWLMTSGPRIVIPARTTRSIESDQAARATGLHETAAPGAVSAGFEPLPVGSGELPRDAMAARTSLRRTVRTRRFLVLFLGAVAIGGFDEGVLQAFVPQAVHVGFGVEFASLGLGLQSLAYVAGQVLGGGLSDRIGRRTVGLGAAIVVVIGTAAAFLAGPGMAGVVLAGIAAHGIGTGATIAVRSAAFSDVFGGPSFGTIFGLLAVAYPIGGALAVYAGALSADQLGNYAAALVIAVVAAFVWAAALWRAGPRRRPSRAHVVAG
ncbi:MAG TPA: MFS transporter [Candidatus Limnocylindrales bacterium]|nr:MFS transporter [Candidatus Limnocylindrales bacterium]